MDTFGNNMRRLVLLAAMAFSQGGWAAAAETYPVKSIRIIVPFAPGGFVDFTARLISVPMGAALGQQIIVDNRGGAGGIVGSELAARSAPDGYTLAIGSLGTHAVNQSLYPDLSYNILRDFQPIARLADAPSILAIHPSLPVPALPHILQRCCSSIWPRRSSCMCRTRAAARRWWPWFPARYR